jgi:hypothetical protein
MSPTPRLIPYADAEAALLRLARGQVTSLYGKLVWRRPDSRTWTIDNGPSLLLLPAMDALLGPPVRDGEPEESPDNLTLYPRAGRRRAAGRA